MSYTALYRKLRPKNFEEVVGQEHIVKTIKNQLKSNRISHAYLFCGTRGTGKTSTAKIFSKLLNCENPINDAPCGQCEQCISFQENRSMNIFEIDAASNNSVEDIREIREEIKYPPTKSKYKIYIIDEVHMLSIGAFNALLKTLEEPPSYVIFILATTDPQKIPITIISRCQRFDFRRISVLDMVNFIKDSIVDENIDIDEDALKHIAIVSDGAMRDALSILDQCNSFYLNEKITLQKVLEILGTVDNSILFDLTDALIDFNSLECINIIDEVILNGRDISQFILDLIQHFRNIIVAFVSSENIIDVSNENFSRLKQQAEKGSSEYFIKLINIFSDAQNQIKYCSSERIILETACIKICSAVSEDDIVDIKEKIKFLEKKLDEKQVTTYVKIEDDKSPKQQPEVKLREIAVTEDFKKVIDNWKSIASKFDVTLTHFLQEAKPRNLEDEFLYIISEKDFPCKEIRRKKEEIEEMLEEMFEKKYTIFPITQKDFDMKYKKVASTPKEELKKENIIQDIEKILPKGTFDIE